MLDALLAALSLPLLAMTTNACAGPAITNAVATQVGTNGDLTTYDVSVTVKNDGPAEPSSLLQSVQVYQDQTKVDQKGTQPLPAGGSTTVHYRFSRSSQAEPGSTRLHFRLVLRDPHGTAFSDCTPDSNYTLNV